MKNVLLIGANGLVGSAILAQKNSIPKDWNLIPGTRYDFGDLTNEINVVNMFETMRPNYVINTVARVGGISGNLKHHGEFCRDNLLMNTHIIHNCMVYKVEKLIAFSSVCVFPHNLALLEEHKMHDGPVFDSNFAYGYAKRMIDVMISAYKRQYRVKNYCSVIPGNIFGPHDNYDLECGHVIPMLIHKLYRAKHFNEQFKIWGDGQSLREFLYTEDIAKWIIQLLQLDILPERVIMSGEKETSIKEVVDILVKAADYHGEIIWEKDKPNGQRSRPSSKQLLKSLLGNLEYTDLKIGLTEAYQWFEENYPECRGVN